MASIGIGIGIGLDWDRYMRGTETDDSCTLSEGRTGSGQSPEVPRRTPRREIADSCTHSEGRMTVPGAEKLEIDDGCTL